MSNIEYEMTEYRKKFQASSFRVLAYPAVTSSTFRPCQSRARQSSVHFAVPRRRTPLRACPPGWHPARPPTTPAGRSGLGVVTAGRERIEACRLSRSEPVMYRSSFGELVNRCSDSTATHRSSSRNSFSVGGGTVSQQGHCDTPSALCG